MGVVVFLVVVAVAGGVLALFYRAVFGGSTFGRGPRSDDGGRGRLPPDAHAGATRWPGGGGLGAFGTWSGGGGGGDGGGGDGGC